MQILGLLPGPKKLRRSQDHHPGPHHLNGHQVDLLAAEQARDLGRWQEAAELFRLFAASHPDRTDIRIQLGNCAKEGGLYKDAFEAFCSVLETEQRRDAELQIGHLLKVTGNLKAARDAFGRARALGDGDAAGEFDSFGSHWLTALRVSQELSNAERALPSNELDTLLATDLESGSAALASRRLAELCFSLGERSLARAFHALADLSSAEAGKRAESIDIATRTGLWSPDHVLKLKRAEQSAQRGRPARARDRLRALLSTALQEPAEDNPQVAKFLPAVAVRPSALEDADADALFAGLVAAIDRVHEAIGHYDGGDPAVVIDAVAALKQRVGAAHSHVALATSATVETFRLHATRILHDRAAAWVSQVEDAYTGWRAAPGLISAFLAMGGNALLERLSEKDDVYAVFDEMATMLADLGIPQPAADRALARLLSIVSPDLAPVEIRAFIDEALQRHLPATAIALVERQMADIDADVVEIAIRFKQAGQPHHALALLERHLDEAAASMGARIEKALVAKTCGDFATAARLLQACADQEPDNEFLKRELVAVLPELEPIESILDRFRSDPLFMRLARERQAYRHHLQAPGQGDHIGMSLVENEVRVVDLAPEIATEFLPHRDGEEHAGIHPVQIGWMTKRGPGLGEIRPLLRRYDFVRVKTAFREPVTQLRVRIDGRTVGATTGVALPTGAPSRQLRHSMFNCWIDLSRVPEGLHELQLYFEEKGGGYQTFEQNVWVDPAPPSREALASAATVDLPDEDRTATLEERIARQPSATFRAARRLLDPPKRILVMRVDQLGDLITSIPAMLRLRDHFPDAELSCLVSPNYASFIEELGIFRETFTLDFPYQQDVGKRHVTLNRQAELRRLLGARRFDVAIDLCFGHMSRPLLRLTQARFTVGFWPQEFPWLDFGMDVRSRDVVTGRYRLPQQTVSNMLIDGLAALVQHKAIQHSRSELEWAALAELGVAPGTPFIIVHTGGRTRSRKWPVPQFTMLAQMLAERMGVKVLVVTDDPADFDDDNRARLAGAGVPLIEHRLSFPVLDSLLSACTVFVGNDSGPKHLAAFRGTPVVSVHGGPINWSEWGQDGLGRIIAHRVPCSGCGIEAVEECGKDLPCLTNITPETVFQAVREEFMQSVADGDGGDAPVGAVETFRSSASRAS